MTINSFSDCTQQYEVTLDDCECKGFRRWGHCQHNEVLQRAYQRARASEFARLMAQYDCRANGSEQTRRCNFEMSLGI